MIYCTFAVLSHRYRHRDSIASSMMLAIYLTRRDGGRAAGSLWSSPRARAFNIGGGPHVLGIDHFWTGPLGDHV